MNTARIKLSPWKLFITLVVVTILLIALVSWWTRLGVESGEWWGPEGPPWNTAVDGEEPTAWDSYEEGSAILVETAEIVGLDVESRAQGHGEMECPRHDGTRGISYTLDPMIHTGAVDSLAIITEVAEYWKQRGVTAGTIFTAPPTNPAVDPAPELVTILGRAPLGATISISAGKGATTLSGESWCSLVSGAPTPFPTPTYVPRPVERVGFINSLLTTMGEKFGFVITDPGLQIHPCGDSNPDGWIQVASRTWTLPASAASEQVFEDIVQWWAERGPAEVHRSAIPSQVQIEVNSSSPSRNGFVTIIRADDGAIQATGRSECFADPTE